MMEKEVGDGRMTIDTNELYQVHSELAVILHNYHKEKGHSLGVMCHAIGLVLWATLKDQGAPGMTVGDAIRQLFLNVSHISENWSGPGQEGATTEVEDQPDKSKLH